MRPIGLLSLAGVSVAVIGGAVALLWALGSSASAREPFSSLETVPADVDLYIAVNTEPASSQWIAFADVLDTLALEDPVREAWNDLLSEQDLRWDKDIVSQLGDEGYLAITDFSTLDDGRGAVAVLQLRDEGRAREMFLERIVPALEDEGEALEETAYEGVTLYLLPSPLGEFSGEEFGFDSADGEESEGFDEDASGEGERAALAFTGGLAIAGLSEEDVRGVIDVVQGRAANVTGDRRFMELRERQTEDFLMWGFADLGAGWDALEEFLAEQEDGEETLEDVERILEELRENADRASFTVSARPDGFIVDATVLRAAGAAGSAFVPARVFETQYASEVPADTVLFAAGYDLFNTGYAPAYDLIKDLPADFDDPYCSQFGEYSMLLPISPGVSGFDYTSDPVYGRFYDEDGNFDYEAYEAWEAEIEQRFEQPDGSYDYDAYAEYEASLYEEACAAKEQKTIGEAIEEFERDAGFDIEDDLLALMTGEWAVALEVSNFDADTPDFAFAGLIDVTDPARMTRTMGLIEEYLEEHEGWARAEIDGDVHRLEPPDDEGDFGASWSVRERTLIAGGPHEYVVELREGLDDEVALAETDDWKRTMALLPAERTFVAYVNIARIISEIGTIEDAAEELEDAFEGEVTLDDLRPIRSIGVATTNIEGGTAARAVVFVND